MIGKSKIQISIVIYHSFMRPRPGLFPGMRRGGRGGRGGRLDPYLLMLVLQLANRIQRLERKPPVTLGLMGRYHDR